MTIRPAPSRLVARAGLKEPVRRPTARSIKAGSPGHRFFFLSTMVGVSVSDGERPPSLRYADLANLFFAGLAVDASGRLALADPGDQAHRGIAILAGASEELRGARVGGKAQPCGAQQGGTNLRRARHSVLDPIVEVEGFREP